MTKGNILVINAAGGIGGDGAMMLLGLPFLAARQLSLHVISIPRGDTFNILRTIPNAKLTTMELGGKDCRTPAKFSIIIRTIEVILAIVRISYYVRRNKIDSIYALDRTIAMGISYIVSLITGCPLVLSAHIAHYLATSRLHRYVIKHSTKITVSSEDMRRKFLPYVEDANKLVTILNAIKIERYNPTIGTSRIREELGIDPSYPIVLLAGRLNPYKGQDDLIRAAAIILKDSPDTFFLLAGSEDGNSNYAAVLKELIDRFEVGHRVKLIGFRSDLPEVIADANICTMPSHEEPFGLVALEAMAMGKPVIASRAGGVPEFLIDGEMGVLINARDYEGLANAILKLISDPRQSELMGQRGRKHVEAYFNERIYGEKVATLLSEVVAIKRAGSIPV